MPVFSSLGVEEFAATTRILLDLATDPRDVATSTNYGSLALVVPDYLYERYNAYMFSEPSPAPDAEPPKKRGPGRPRKIPLPEELA